jgi:hypothetical protein
VGVRLGSEGALRAPFIIVLVTLALYYALNGKFRFSTKGLVITLIFVMLTAIHITLISTPISKTILLIDYGKYILLLFLYQFIAFNIKFNSFNEDSYAFLRGLAIFSLILWIISMVSGIKIGVDDSYSPDRLSGFASEPANMAHFLPSLLLYAYYNNKWKELLLFSTVILLTFSPTNYLVTVGTFLAISFYRKSFSHKLIFLCVPLNILLVFMYSFKEGIVSNDSNFILLTALFRIYEGLDYVISLGESGANNRAELFFAGAGFLTEYNLWFIGTGFGSSTVVADSFNNGLLFDSNSWSSIVLWFGVFPLIPYFYLQHKALSTQRVNFGYFLLTNLVVSNFITGGGVWYQILLFLLVTIKLMDRKTPP